MIKQLRVVAWHEGDSRAAIERPSMNYLTPHKAQILASIKTLRAWITETENGRPKPPTKADVKPLFDAFGYDPFVGTLYRGIRTEEVYERGQIIDYKPKYQTTSWTSDIDKAHEFASTEYMMAINRTRRIDMRGYIIKYGGRKADQLCSALYITTVLEYLLAVGFDSSIKDHLRVFTWFAESEVILWLPSSVKAEVLAVVD